MMIKGTLLASIPIIKRFSVENFPSPKKHTFGAFFSDPLEKNPWTDIRETYGHVLPSQALRPAIFGAKVLSAVSKITRLIKKKMKNMRKTIQPSVPAYAGGRL